MRNLHWWYHQVGGRSPLAAKETMYQHDAFLLSTQHVDMSTYACIAGALSIYPL